MVMPNSQNVLCAFMVTTVDTLFKAAVATSVSPNEEDWVRDHTKVVKPSNPIAQRLPSSLTLRIKT